MSVSFCVVGATRTSSEECLNWQKVLMLGHNIHTCPWFTYQVLTHANFKNVQLIASQCCRYDNISLAKQLASDNPNILAANEHASVGSSVGSLLVQSPLSSHLHPFFLMSPSKECNFRHAQLISKVKQ